MIDGSSGTALTSSLEELAGAYVPCMVVGAAFELALFDHLGEPTTSDALARAVGATPVGLRRLLRALVALGLVSSEGGRFFAPHASLLRRDAATGLAALYLHHQRLIAPLLSRIGETVRQGSPDYAAWPFADSPPAPSAYEELGRHPEEFAWLLGALERASVGVGEQIARCVDLEGIERLIDLGGGGGGIARELLRSVPSLRVESYDLPAACRFARERTRAEGLCERHRIIEADIREPLAVAPAGAVLLAGVLADFPPDERHQLLERTHALVEADGWLLVSESLLDDDREGPLEGALLSLVLLAAFGGEQLTERELLSSLERVGFGEVVCHRGPRRDLVAAKKV